MRKNTLAENSVGEGKAMAEVPERPEAKHLHSTPATVGGITASDGHVLERQRGSTERPRVEPQVKATQTLLGNALIITNTSHAKYCRTHFICIIEIDTILRLPNNKEKVCSIIPEPNMSLEEISCIM